MTKFTVEEVSPVERCIHVELSAEEVQAAMGRAYDAINAHVSVPGFRKGKAPRRHLEKLYKGRAVSDAIESLLQASYSEVLQKTPDLVPITMPKIVPEEFKENAPFIYKATVEIRPAITLASIEGLPLHKHDLTVTDEKIDDAVEQIRIAHAEEIPAEGRDTAEKGDIATVDFTGSIDGKPFAGGEEKDAQVELVEGDFMRDGKSDVLIGAKIGETRSLSYTFTKDLVGEGNALIGKTAVVELKLKALATRRLPEVNDGLAKAAKLGETVAEMREKIREDMAHQAMHAAERHTREQLLAGLRERNPIQVPPSMVESLAVRKFEDIKRNLASQGVPVSDKMTLSQSPMAAQLRTSAEQDVRDALLLDAVADQEKIEVSDADLEAKAAHISEDTKLTLDQVRSYVMSPQMRSSFVGQIREEKTIALLESKAALTDAPETHGDHS